MDSALRFAQDLDDDDLIEADGQPLAEAESLPPPPPGAEIVGRELARVESFIARCEALKEGSKARRLREALQLVEERAARGHGSGKVVIFTESLTTQAYLRDLLVDNGLSATDITLFRGQNDSERAKQALASWQREVGAEIPRYRRPSAQVAVRLALVHEFRTRSRVFIATEAGAKGLNLQFCDTVINYDLPWNPQRIEQRIGRCHRYGQQRTVTVINFVNRDNEAERLAFDILSQKLDLFGTVLDASDTILHTPSTPAPEALVGVLGSELLDQRQKLYDRARNQDELVAGMAELLQTIEARRQAVEARWNETRGLIEARFDSDVQRVFRRLQHDLQAGLANLDRDLTQLVSDYMASSGVSFRRYDEPQRVVLEVAASAQSSEPLEAGRRYAIGDAKGRDSADPLHLTHPVVRAAIAEAIETTQGLQAVRFRLGSDSPAVLFAAAGQPGCLAVAKVRHGGFEPTERLVATALIEGDPEPLPDSIVKQLLAHPVTDAPDLPQRIPVDEDRLAAAIEEGVFLDRAQAEADDEERYARGLDQIERYIEDRILVLGRHGARLDERLKEAARRHQSALSSEARGQAEALLGQLRGEHEEVQARLDKLVAREDPAYRRWRQHLQQRRYVPPQVSRVLTVVFELEPA